MSQQLTTDNRIEVKPKLKGRSYLAGKRAAIKVLLLGTTATFSPEEREEMSSILSGTVDWEYLLHLAEFHGVAPLIAHNINQNGLSNLIPESYLEQLNQIYNHNVFRNVFLSDKLIKLLTVFNQHGIEVITLKGIVLAEQLYTNFGLRTTTDIDILVQKEKMHLASSILLEMGYLESTQKKEREHPFHRVYYNSVQFPLRIELHWDLDDPKIVEIPLAEIWHRAELLQFQGSLTTVLSPEDNLLYIANNLLTQDGQQLKYLCDITELIKINQDTLNWDYIIESAGPWGIIPAAYYSLKWARELLGAQVPASAMEALQPAAWKRWLVNLLMNNRTLCSPVRWSKLRSETLALVRSLMKSRTEQSIAVLARYRGYGKKFVWLRTIAWIPLVFGAALWLNAGNILSKWR
jgi:hypothetical protein